MVTNFLMILLLTSIVVVALAGIKYNGNLGEFWSLRYTTALKGIFCIIIVLVHVPSNYQNRIQDLIGSFAYIGTTFFFMASAYGLKYGYEHKKNYLSTFWRNRIGALLVPAIITNIVLCTIRWCIWRRTGEYLFNNIFSIDNWVRVLIFFYLLFYVVYRLFPDDKYSLFRDLILCGLVIASSLISKLTPLKITKIWPTECMGFIYGILLARYFDNIKRCLSKSSTFFGGGGLLAISLVLGVLYLKYKTVYFMGDYVLKIILCIVLLSLLFWVTCKFSIGNKVSLFLGTISYEIYIVHGAVFNMVKKLDFGIESGTFILLSLLLTIGLATGIHCTSKPVIKLIRKFGVIAF